MTLLKYKDIAKMPEKERNEKMKELKIQLIKAGVTANRTNGKTKEIKKAISRIITFNKSTIGGVEKSK